MTIDLDTRLTAALKDAATTTHVDDMALSTIVDRADATGTRYATRARLHTQPLPRPHATRLVWVGAAGAVVALLVGIGALTRQQSPAVVAPLSVPVAPLGESWTTVAMLPADMPAGYRLVDLDSWNAGNGTLVLEDLAVVAQKGGDARAVLRRFDTVDEPFAATTVDSAEWENDALSWTEGDRSFVLSTARMNEPKARDLARALVVVDAEQGPDVRLPTDSGFTVEQTWFRRGVLEPRPAGVRLGVVDPTGARIDITVSTKREVPPVASLLAVPEPVDGFLEFRSQGPGPRGESGPVIHLTKFVDDVGIESSFSERFDSPQLRQLLSSLAEATTSEWAAARGSITDLIAATPTVGRAELLDAEVTIHRDDHIAGVCVRRDGSEACDWSDSIDAAGNLIDDAGPVASVRLPTGAWLALDTLTDAGFCPLDAPADHATAEINGQAVVLVEPSLPATQIACSLPADTGPAWTFSASLPDPGVD